MSSHLLMLPLAEENPNQKTQPNKKCICSPTRMEKKKKAKKKKKKEEKKMTAEKEKK